MISGPQKFTTLDKLGRFLSQYDVIFFKGGLIEPAFVRRFVNKDIIIVNLESLGCPKYDTLLRNSDFKEAADLQSDPLTCVNHQDQEELLHCATSEVAHFARWLQLDE